MVVEHPAVEAAPPVPSPVRYRTDIDGLRAVAVLPIVLLHSGFEQLRGGFIGVDIFFVISGYLITLILVRDLDRGRFSLRRFYRHRIVRILPALGVMMLATLAAGCLMLLPNPLRELGRSTAWASVFGSNIDLTFSAFYFGVGADTRPLLHTWSLAVEEQFYLLYPPLLWALRGSSRARLARVLGGLAAMSLAVAGFLGWRDPGAGFFLLPSRIWELAAGGLVALGAFPTLDARLRGLLSLGALGTIAGACIVISPNWPFPFPFAIVPVCAAAALIAYGEDTPAGRLLAWTPLRAVGLISYSIYLWHRPIVTFYTVRTGTDIDAGEAAALTGAAIAIAAMSYWLVERPARRVWRDGCGLGVHAAALGGIAAVAALGLMVAHQADAIRPLPPRLATIAGYLGWDATPAGRRQFGTGRCFALPSGAMFDPACLHLSASRPNVALIGDSHAAQYAQALRAAVPQANVVQATAAGCRPLVDGRGLLRCRAVMDRAFATLDFSRVDAVVLSALWLDFERERLGETVRWLTARGTRVVVLGPGAGYDADLPTLLVQAARTGDRGLPARHRDPGRFVLDRALARIVTDAGGDYVSVLARQCPDGSCRLLVPGGIPMQFDHSHVTPAAARAIIAPLADRILPPSGPVALGAR